MSDRMVDGVIFDIKRYAIHDGPGIRTTIFFKGCPLSCWWCHNPEGQVFKKELMVWSRRCIKCGLCISACTYSAISVSNNSIETNREKCKINGACTEKCPTNAREIVGKRVSVTELMQEIEKDLPFYGKSGGITVSGGEPLAQPTFLNTLLNECKKKGIHTALDTSGYSEKKILTRISKNVDLFLYDLKMIDNKIHKVYTGASNIQIIKNLKLLDTLGKMIIIRFPLIPNVNDCKDDIQTMCNFVSELRNVKEVDILPYHRLGAEKAKRLDKEVKIFQKPKKVMLNQTLKLIKSYGLVGKIGG